MRNYTKNKPGSGNDGWTDFVNWVKNKFTELEIYDSTTVKVKQGTRGLTLHVKPGAAAAPTKAAGTVVQYDVTGGTAYSGGTIAFVASQFTLSGITVLPGTYALLSSKNTTVGPTGNQIPQIPMPISGTLYWIPIAAGLIQASACNSGGSATIYINSTGTF